MATSYFSKLTSDLQEYGASGIRFDMINEFCAMPIAHLQEIILAAQSVLFKDDPPDLHRLPRSQYTNCIMPVAPEDRFNCTGDPVTDSAGVLHAITSRGVRMLDDCEKFRPIAQNLPEWPMMIGPHPDRIAYAALQMKKLGLAPQKFPGRNTQERKNSKDGRQLARLRDRFVERQIYEIEICRRYPDSFIRSEYFVPDVELREWDPSMQSPSPWWKKWTKLASGLGDLTTHTASKWADLVETKVMEEYEGAPEKAPCHPFLRLEDLRPLGLSSHKCYHRDRAIKNKSLLNQEQLTEKLREIDRMTVCDGKSSMRQEIMQRIRKGVLAAVNRRRSS